MSLRPETRERMFWQRVEKSDSYEFTLEKNKNYGSRRWLCPTCGSEVSFSWRSKHIKLHKETR